MPTKEECTKGIHTTDNQGLCWWCARIVDCVLWAEYTGEKMSDTQIRQDLEDLDNSDIDVTAWEAKFIDSVVYKQAGPLSKLQKDTALAILRKYEGKF